MDKPVVASVVQLIISINTQKSFWKGDFGCAGGWYSNT